MATAKHPSVSELQPRALPAAAFPVDRLECPTDVELEVCGTPLSGTAIEVACDGKTWRIPIQKRASKRTILILRNGSIIAQLKLAIQVPTLYRTPRLILSPLATKFGDFGGQYVPESLFGCLAELEVAFNEARADPAFWKEFRSYCSYIGRPSQLYRADRLTEYGGGATIWMKREDLMHTGSYKINNALGQILLARRLRKTEIIAETGSGQHGVAVAAVCAKFGLNCTVYMGAKDMTRQAVNVSWMGILGATVVPVTSGSQKVRDAISEAMRALVTSIPTAYYAIGSAIGPHPLPTLVRTFQSVIGEETKLQMYEKRNKAPDAVVACVGAGSNAIGMFYPFSKDPNVKLVGVEASGAGLHTKTHCAALTAGSEGVLHGMKTFVLQDQQGQVQETHSIAAGLDYGAVGPELANWKARGRVCFMSATDCQALESWRLSCRLEGIIPALETAHAIFGALEVAKMMTKNQDVVVCVSGRGDKDLQMIAGPKCNL